MCVSLYLSNLEAGGKKKKNYILFVNSRFVNKTTTNYSILIKYLRKTKQQCELEF